MRFVDAAFAAAFTLAAMAGVPAIAAENLDHLLKRVQLPPGFKINLFAKVPRARSMVVGKPLGTVFVGSRHGSVHILLDRDKDGVAEEIVKKTDKLKVPNGVAFNGMFLYVAEQHRIVRWAPPSEFDSTRRSRPGCSRTCSATRWKKPTSRRSTRATWSYCGSSATSSRALWTQLGCGECYDSART